MPKAQLQHAPTLPRFPSNSYCTQSHACIPKRTYEGFAAATSPHFGHFLPSSSSIHLLITGFSWVSRSEQWNVTSLITVR